jgi:hypothetical protein
LDFEPTPRSRDLIWNLATAFVVACIPLVAASVLIIFFDPQSSINPFPPPTLPAKLVLPSATGTPAEMPPTWTPTLPQTNESTAIPQATVTPTPDVIVFSGTPIDELEGPEPTETIVVGGFSFMRQGDPQAISASLYDANRQCAWMGVAGRVFDLQGRPVNGIRVLLRGSLGGRTVQLLSLTGTAVQYGPSGYEFTLSDAPIASSGTLSVRLLDQSDLALSERVVFDTYVDCDKNLLLIDFKQVR